MIRRGRPFGQATTTHASRQALRARRPTTRSLSSALAFRTGAALRPDKVQFNGRCPTSPSGEPTSSPQQLGATSGDHQWFLPLRFCIARHYSFGVSLSTARPCLGQSSVLTGRVPGQSQSDLGAEATGTVVEQAAGAGRPALPGGRFAVSEGDHRWNTDHATRAHMHPYMHRGCADTPDFKPSMADAGFGDSEDPTSAARSPVRRPGDPPRPQPASSQCPLAPEGTSGGRQRPKGDSRGGDIQCVSKPCSLVFQALGTTRNFDRRLQA